MITHFSVEGRAGLVRLLELTGADLAIPSELDRVLRLIERAAALGYRFDGIKVGPTVFAGLVKEILGTPPGWGFTTLSIGTSIGSVDVIVDPALPDWGMYDYVAGAAVPAPHPLKAPLEPWKAWQHNMPGECPCGIARAVCDYHKP